MSFSKFVIVQGTYDVDVTGVTAINLSKKATKTLKTISASGKYKVSRADCK
jgi:hypothetical protein